MNEKTSSLSQRQPDNGDRAIKREPRAPLVFDVYVSPRGPLLEGLASMAKKRKETITQLNDEKTAHAATKEALEMALAEKNRLVEELTAQRLVVAGMIHDLKTPLTVIIGYSELVEKEYGQKIGNAADRMTKIMACMQDFFRAEGGMLKVRPQKIDVGEDLRVMVELMHYIADEKRVTLKVAADKPVCAWADPHILHHVVINLVGNGIKYNRENGIVTVSVAEKDGSAIISVSDNGIGIPANDLPFIFDPYHRVEGNKGIEGSGLGLMVVKKFTEIMGGTVSVESELGKGSAFTVTLPGVPTET